MHTGKYSIVKMNKTFSIISLFILIFSIISINVHGQEILEYKELNCEYSLTTGDRICDCKNRNKVI